MTAGTRDSLHNGGGYLESSVIGPVLACLHVVGIGDGTPAGKDSARTLPHGRPAGYARDPAAGHRTWRPDSARRPAHGRDPTGCPGARFPAISTDASKSRWSARRNSS